MKIIGSPDALFTYPMHGQRKLSMEGYRTRDGHLIEWFGRLHRGKVFVVSRPEPILVRPFQKGVVTDSVAENTVPINSTAYRAPSLRDRRRWWKTSANSYPMSPIEARAAVVWNPFVALSDVARNPFMYSKSSVLDLLDDWSLHFHFEKLQSEVEHAYRAAFNQATFVTANSEGTLALAHRFGRTDAKLLPNGVDPGRFSSSSRATGPITLGYVGKIGKRIDIALVETVAAAFPDIKIVFAGPILDQEYRPRLSAIPNLRLLGDVHYRDLPQLLATFDIGWVPHRVGEGEVGGDVIKTYEYRAAGLPVLATPISGLGNQGLDNISILSHDSHADWLRSITHQQTRIRRTPTVIPPALTWETKAKSMLDLLYGV